VRLAHAGAWPPEAESHLVDAPGSLRVALTDCGSAAPGLCFARFTEALRVRCRRWLAGRHWEALPIGIRRARAAALQMVEAAGRGAGGAPAGRSPGARGMAFER